eukprot:10507411-Alexandrium_andersonii.AAC.1
MYHHYNSRSEHRFCRSFVVRPRKNEPNAKAPTVVSTTWPSRLRVLMPWRHACARFKIAERFNRRQPHSRQ